MNVLEFLKATLLILAFIPSNSFVIPPKTLTSFPGFSHQIALNPTQRVGTGIISKEITDYASFRKDSGGASRPSNSIVSKNSRFSRSIGFSLARRFLEGNIGSNDENYDNESEVEVSNSANFRDMAVKESLRVIGHDLSEYLKEALLLSKNSKFDETFLPIEKRQKLLDLLNDKTKNWDWKDKVRILALADKVLVTKTDRKEAANNSSRVSRFDNTSYPLFRRRSRRTDLLMLDDNGKITEAGNREFADEVARIQQTDGWREFENLLVRQSLRVIRDELSRYLKDFMAGNEGKFKASRRLLGLTKMLELIDNLKKRVARKYDWNDEIQSMLEDERSALGANTFVTQKPLLRSANESAEKLSSNKDIISKKSRSFRSRRFRPSDFLMMVDDSTQKQKDLSGLRKLKNAMFRESVRMLADDVRRVFKRLISRKSRKGSKSIGRRDGRVVLKELVEKIPLVKNIEEIVNDGKKISKDGKEVVTDSKEVVKDGKEIFKDGKEVIDDGRSINTDVEEVVGDTEEIVKDGEVIVKDGKEIVKDSEKVIDEGEEIFKDGAEIVKDGEEFANNPFEVIKDGKEIVDDAKQVYGDGKQLVDQGREIFKDGKEVIFDGEEVLKDSEEVLGKGKEGLEDGKEVVNDSKEVFTDGKEIVSDGGEILAGGTEINNGTKEIINGTKEIINDAKKVGRTASFLRRLRRPFSRNTRLSMMADDFHDDEMDDDEFPDDWHEESIDSEIEKYLHISPYLPESKKSQADYFSNWWIDLNTQQALQNIFSSDGPNRFNQYPFLFGGNQADAIHSIDGRNSHDSEKIDMDELTDDMDELAKEIMDLIDAEQRYKNDEERISSHSDLESDEDEDSESTISPIESALDVKNHDSAELKEFMKQATSLWKLIPLVESANSILNASTSAEKKGETITSSIKHSDNVSSFKLKALDAILKFATLDEFTSFLHKHVRAEDRFEFFEAAMERKKVLDAQKESTNSDDEAVASDIENVDSTKDMISENAKFDAMIEEMFGFKPIYLDETDEILLEGMIKEKPDISSFSTTEERAVLAEFLDEKDEISYNKPPNKSGLRINSF